MNKRGTPPLAFGDCHQKSKSRLIISLNTKFINDRKQILTAPVVSLVAVPGGLVPTKRD